ncbi:MAG: DUF3141 domain-containing protein, partial [Desulfobacterales bacterium]
LKSYGTVGEIKRRGQVIVVMGHSLIGHLGIFVSAKIARMHHKEIIASFDMLNFLPPGLYEMRIEEEPAQPGEFRVRYAEKNMDHLRALDDGLEDEEAFFAVRRVSETGDMIYRALVSPWVRMTVSADAAELLRQLHPLRVQRYLFSDLNPWMIPVKAWAASINSGTRRRPAAEDNIYSLWEKSFSDFIVHGLDHYRELRDKAFERTFKALYESPAMKMMADFLAPQGTHDLAELEALRRRDAARWWKNMTEGEFADAMVRIFLAIGFADQVAGRRAYGAIGRVIQKSPLMKELLPEDLKQIIREQSRILQTDRDQAIDSLPTLLSESDERLRALAMLSDASKELGRALAPQEQSMLHRIETLLAH